MCVYTMFAACVFVLLYVCVHLTTDAPLFQSCLHLSLPPNRQSKHNELHADSRRYFANCCDLIGMINNVAAWRRYTDRWKSDAVGKGERQSTANPESPVQG